MHHTKEQVAAAFARAPEVLNELTEAGVPRPYFQLYADASGMLVLGNEDDHITSQQYELATRLVRSNRQHMCWSDERIIAIDFCCGLVPLDMQENPDDG